MTGLRSIAIVGPADRFGDTRWQPHESSSRPAGVEEIGARRRWPRHGQVANAPVSCTGWNAVPNGFR